FRTKRRTSPVVVSKRASPRISYLSRQRAGSAERWTRRASHSGPCSKGFWVSGAGVAFLRPSCVCCRRCVTGEVAVPRGLEIDLFLAEHQRHLLVVVARADRLEQFAGASAWLQADRKHY